MPTLSNMADAAQSSTASNTASNPISLEVDLPAFPTARQLNKVAHIDLAIPLLRLTEAKQAHLIVKLRDGRGSIRWGEVYTETFNPVNGCGRFYQVIQGDRPFCFLCDQIIGLIELASVKWKARKAKNLPTTQLQDLCNDLQNDRDAAKLQLKYDTEAKNAATKERQNLNDHYESRMGLLSTSGSVQAPSLGRPLRPNEARGLACLGGITGTSARVTPNQQLDHEDGDFGRDDRDTIDDVTEGGDGGDISNVTSRANNTGEAAAAASSTDGGVTGGASTDGGVTGETDNSTPGININSNTVATPPHNNVDVSSRATTASANVAATAAMNRRVNRGNRFIVQQQQRTIAAQAAGADFEPVTYSAGTLPRRPRNRDNVETLDGFQGVLQFGMNTLSRYMKNSGTGAGASPNTSKRNSIRVELDYAIKRRKQAVEDGMETRRWDATINALERKYEKLMEDLLAD